MLQFNRFDVSFSLSETTFTLRLLDDATPAIAVDAEPFERLAPKDLVRVMELLTTLAASQLPADYGRRPRSDAPRLGQMWSDAEEHTLRELFDKGAPISEIASALGRTQGAIRGRLVRLGLLDEATAGLMYPVARSAPSA